MDALKNMRRLEKAMNEELKNIIAYYDGCEDGKIIYEFNYTELCGTLNLQKKAVEDIKEFVKKHHGTISQELPKLTFGFRVIFECE